MPDFIHKKLPGQRQHPTELTSSLDPQHGLTPCSRPPSSPMPAPNPGPWGLQQHHERTQPMGWQKPCQVQRYLTPAEQHLHILQSQ